MTPAEQGVSALELRLVDCLAPGEVPGDRTGSAGSVGQQPRVERRAVRQRVAVLMTGVFPGVCEHGAKPGKGLQCVHERRRQTRAR